MAIKGKSVKKNELKYEILEVYAERILDNGQVFRVAEVSWNDKPAKFDIRKWTPQDDGTERCGKGFTLNEDEINMLKDMLNEIDEGESQDENEEN